MNETRTPNLNGGIAELLLAYTCEVEERERANRRFKAWQDRQPIRPDLIVQNGKRYIPR